MALSELFNGTPALAEGLEKMKEVEGAVLLDVRAEDEYQEGHVEGSINIPLNKLAAISLPKETPLFVYCLAGGRAEKAVKFLKKAGYDAVNIGGVKGYEGTLVS